MKIYTCKVFFLIDCCTTIVQLFFTDLMYFDEFRVRHFECFQFRSVSFPMGIMRFLMAPNRKQPNLGGIKFHLCSYHGYLFYLLSFSAAFAFILLPRYLGLYRCMLSFYHIFVGSIVFILHIFTK